MNAPLIGPIAESDFDAFHACLDAVARERRYLALFEAPPLEHTRGFLREGLTKGVARMVARQEGQVVGWCDISPEWPQSRSHVGSVGMGLLPEWRGKGLGQALLEQCIQQARASGIERIELDVRVDNLNAQRLYERLGFEREGIRRGAIKVDGQAIDTIAMALFKR